MSLLLCCTVLMVRHFYYSGLVQKKATSRSSHFIDDCVYRLLCSIITDRNLLASSYPLHLDKLPSLVCCNFPLPMPNFQLILSYQTCLHNIRTILEIRCFQRREFYIQIEGKWKNRRWTCNCNYAGIQKYLHIYIAEYIFAV